MNLLTDPSFLVSLLGTLAGLVGVYYSFIASKEAKQAKEAAKSASNQVKKINAIVDTSGLITMCNEVITHFDNKAYISAKIRVRDILRGMNYLKAQGHTKNYIEEDSWISYITDVSDVEEFLFSIKDGTDEKRDGISQCRIVIKKVEELLIRISTECRDAVGEV